jgi:hypothetical protein
VWFKNAIYSVYVIHCWLDMIDVYCNPPVVDEIPSNQIVISVLRILFSFVCRHRHLAASWFYRKYHVTLNRLVIRIFSYLRRSVLNCFTVVSLANTGTYFV